MPRCLSRFAWLLLIFTLPVARADLVLTNFTSTHPLKVMAVGDSITDDCVYNGAWRSYLQTLLQTNGYFFTFVGRESSVVAGSFTQTNHEGMCGAVIAPPGMMTSAVHGYAGTEVYLQKTLRDALTSITPDLVLILIGANDIGHGRDPWLTATNDMPNLLDLIFSNAPNANVILANITTLQNAVANYGNYVGNVPVYNAALQRVVNQRRAAGQNVFLADMFSVVDYFTMFNSDHLHPNAAGLQAIAREWFYRIQSITIRSNPVLSVLVRGGDSWQYNDTGVDLGTNWVRPDYDDRAWSSGPARLGYGDKVAATLISYGPASTNKYPTTYFRHSFVLPTELTITNLVLRLAQAHGSVVWLNGQEIWRTNLPPGPIGFTNLAQAYPVTFETAYLFNSIPVDSARLLPGTNILAEELHQRTASHPFVGFDLELIGAGMRTPPPTLSLAFAGTNLVFAWPADNGGGFGLYASTDLAGTNWTAASLSPRTNGAQLVVTQSLDAATKFFRLQKN